MCVNACEGEIERSSDTDVRQINNRNVIIQASAIVVQALTVLVDSD